MGGLEDQEENERRGLKINEMVKVLDNQEPYPVASA